MMMLKRNWLLGATLIIAVSCGGRVRAAEADDALAAKVLAVFKEKCFSCHSPQAKVDQDVQAKKGMKHLDYIDDFSQLRANAKFIVQGDPSKSLLHKQLIEDEMPPDDSGVTPLTDSQKNLVKQWIAAGAPVGKTVPLPRPVATTGPTKQRTFLSRLIEFFGHFHPLAAHTPIAVLMAAAIAELL
jgi:hypothetical protein